MRTPPRAHCQVCRRIVAVRVNGRLREHRESYTSSMLCAGSGAVATEYHEDPMFDLDAS